MKIKNIRIMNFRGYMQETKIDFNDLTAFVVPRPYICEKVARGVVRL